MSMTFWTVGNGLLPWGVAIGASLVAALCDLTRCRIPNVLTGPLWVTGLFYCLWLCRWAGLGSSFAGSLLLASPFVLLFVFAGGGAGDAKLMGALGAWLCVGNAMLVLVAVCTAGVAVGLLFAMRRGRLLGALASTGLTVRSLGLWVLGAPDAFDLRVHEAPVARTHPHAFPYAVAVLLGVIAAAGVRLWHV